MLESTRMARADAFALRQEKKYEQALVVIRSVWPLETDPITRALLKLDAAFAYVGLGNYEKASRLLNGISETPNLGDKSKKSALQLAAHVKTKLAAARMLKLSNPTRTKPYKRKWRRTPDLKGIRVIDKKFVPRKFKPASRPGWRRDVGY